MNKSGLLGGIGDELKQLGKDAVKTVKESPKDLAKAAASQIGLEHEPGAQEKSPESHAKVSEQANKELLEAMYGTSEKSSHEQTTQPPAQSKEDLEFQKQLEGKTPEEQQELIKKRQELASLHTTNYYEPLVQKIKQEGETPEGQERTAERVERLEMEDLQEKKKKEEKKKPIAVDRAERSIEGATKDAAG